MAYCYGITGANNDIGVVALPPAMVTGIKVTTPGASAITLGWDSVADAVSYNIYHSSSQSAAPGKIGSSVSASFTDDAVSIGVNYYYTIAPVNADGKEGVWVQGAFAYAAPHYSLPTLSSSQTTNLYPNTKDYYRIAVSAGQRITITWQDGNNQNASNYIRVSSWQNDGTAIFTGASYGYTSPKEFTVTGAGYVTVEVNNSSSSTSYDYQIYYFAN
jgi:fibronectin type 3 domain-containing protein